MENIINIDVLRVNRRVEKKCTCDVKKYSVDTVNREITCGCGMVVDPFEAMLDLATHYERVNDQHKALHEQSQQWKKEKPYSVIFKGLEQHYGRGTMLPHCPKCEAMFDFKDITFWGNAQFYRKLEQSLLK